MGVEGSGGVAARTTARVRFIAQQRLDAKGIAEAAGVLRASVFNYLDKLGEGGVGG